MDLKNWMSYIDDDKKLFEVNFVGTHDCATQFVQLPTLSCCQDKNIHEQLNMGIRCLDIRVKSSGDRLILVHGICDVFANPSHLSRRLDMADVLGHCYHFLENHPSEVIILQFKNDSNKEMEKCYDILRTEYIRRNTDKWYMANRVPSIKEVRGKIVLLRRCAIDYQFSVERSGIDISKWVEQDEAVPTALTLRAAEDIEFLIQDRFKYKPEEKWNDCLKPFLDERGAFDGTYVINYASTAGGTDGPKHNARYINKMLMDYDFKKGTYYGITYTDFPSEELVTKILSTNFQTVTMKASAINIRDPFILNENGTYYLYGTRAEGFGRGVAGFDVYTSGDLVEFSEPTECFNSAENGYNRDVNWAPEVHKHNGKYYMLATFTKENGLRGTYSLVADSPMGPFTPHSSGALTPYDWECLDGTLYVSGDGVPYLVFCHEHTQIIDGSICYIRLNDDLSEAIGEPVLMFHGSAPSWADDKPDGEHYITDGPFMYRTSGGRLLMIWSTFIGHNYAQCVARSSNDELDGEFEHLPPLIANDGGHGMIFRTNDNRLMLTIHTPNKTNYERPVFMELADTGDEIKLL